MHWYVDVLKKYAEFDGRAGREEFWMFFLINLAVSIAVNVIGGFIGLGGILGTLYFLAVLLPAVGVGIRRLHDTGRTGLWMLIGLIPIIGLVLLVFMALPGQTGENEYGPDPRMVPV